MRLVGPPLRPPRVPTLVAALQAAADSTQGLVLADARDNDVPLPFARLDDGARTVAAALAAQGVEPGDRVAMSMPTSRDFLAVFFGIQYAAAVPVPIAPPAQLGQARERLLQIGGMLRAVQARLIVTQPPLLAALAGAAAGAPGCRAIVAADLGNGSGWLLREPEPVALGLIQFSSGTTSDPKPVALSHANLVAQVASLEMILDDAGGCGVSWLPLYHDMGLIGSLLSAVYHARPLVLLTPEAFLIRPVSWLRAITRHRATVSPAPNFAFRQCVLRVRDAELDGLDLSSWRTALSGGEAVSWSVMSRFVERFAPVGFDARALRPAYGLAESSLAVSATLGLPAVRVLPVDAQVLAARGRAVPPAAAVREIVSVGRAVPGAEIEVRDDQGQALPPDCVGRIHTRSPSVMAGYFGDGPATACAIRDGWLDTGDLGFIHEGELYVSGRAKDVVIIRGANHSAQEFEDCLAEVEGLRSGFAAVAAGFVPPGGDEEELLVLVERGVDAPDDLPLRVAAAILERTGIRPHTVHVVGRGLLPRTTSGKLRRAEAVRRFLAGELVPAGGNPSAGAA